MDLMINTTSMVPIYEQLVGTIRKRIAAGELRDGDALPSVRSLAAELKISALTVKKAYDCLEGEGLVATVHGKGTYVTAANTGLLLEEQRLEVERLLAAAAERARVYGIPDEELAAMLALLLDNEK